MASRPVKHTIDRAMSLDTGMMRNDSLSGKGVRFQESAEILSRSPLDEGEKAGMWYTSRDLHAVRQESKMTLRALKGADWNPAALDQSEHCLRGLEDLQKRGGIKEKKNRTRSLIQGVLDEQFNQRQMGIQDPKGLRMLASACSKQARERALLTGKKDETEAKEILHDASCSSLDASLGATTDSSSVGSDSQKLLERSYGTTITVKERQSKLSYARSA